MYHYKSTKLMSIFLFQVYVFTVCIIISLLNSCLFLFQVYVFTVCIIISLLNSLCVHCMYHYKSTKLMSLFLFQVYVFTVCIIISLLNSCLYFCFKYMCSLYVSL